MLAIVNKFDIYKISKDQVNGDFIGFVTIELDKLENYMIDLYLVTV